MKEATAAYFDKARQSLDKARRVLAIGIHDEAGAIPGSRERLPG